MFLLAGAALNVIVAWVCALESHRLGTVTYRYGEWGGTVIDITTGIGTVSIWEDRFTMSSIPAPAIQIDDQEYQAMLPAWSRLRAKDRAKPQGLMDYQEFAAGWPMRSFRGRFESFTYFFLPERQVDEDRPKGLIILPERFVPFRSMGWLPFIPIPVGFIINTIFYASVPWLLFIAPFALRRRLRIKRGLCPACAYPVGTSPVCTECGKPVAPKSVGPVT